MNEMPQSLLEILQRKDRKAPALPCRDDTWLVVGVDALVIAHLQGADAEPLVEEEPWYGLQFVRWDARTAQVSIKWMDPGRPVMELTSIDEDPGYFMTALDERLTHAVVVQKQEIATNGTRVTASVRRGPNGLFSAVVADGPLDSEGSALADYLEALVRDGVGLE